MAQYYTSEVKSLRPTANVGHRPGITKKIIKACDTLHPSPATKISDKGGLLFFDLLVRDSSAEEQNLTCLQRPRWTPPSFFFYSLPPFQQNSLPLGSPKPPADTPSSCPRARRADGARKTHPALQAPTIKRPSRHLCVCVGGGVDRVSCSDNALMKSILEDTLGFDTLGRDSNASTRLHLPAKG